MVKIEPRIRPIYPRPEVRDTSKAYAASSLTQKPPSLVDMARDTERKVNRVYNGSLDSTYMREAARDAKKGKIDFNDYLPNSLHSQ